MTAPPALRPAHRALICLVLAALLLAQALGMVHRVLHGAHAAPVQALVLPHAERQHAQLLAALFDGHEEGQVECRLFDQISHADLAAADLPVFEATLTWRPARRAWALARGRSASGLPGARPSRTGLTTLPR